MPNFNHAPYLKERMDSILSQDYPDFEVVVLDDASTDTSAMILREYAAHPKVKKLLLNPRNSGNTFVQWQRGLELADGEYVWIAESDDVAAPGFLSRMVAALEQEDAVLAFCQSEWIDSEGHAIQRHTDSRWNRNFSMDGKAFVKQNLLGYSFICNASAVLFRREAAAAIDMAEVAQFRASGDRWFWIQMAMQGKVTYVAERMNRFRQHNQKVSGSAEYQGLNIMQDYAIYRLAASQLSLTRHERRLICGYHWQAMHRRSVSSEGREKAMTAWKEEPLFGPWAYVVYMIHRAKEKC